VLFLHLIRDIQPQTGKEVSRKKEFAECKITERTALKRNETDMKKNTVIEFAGKLVHLVFGAVGNPLFWLTILVSLSVTAIAPGQDAANPLKPLDRSSPRAALKTFLDSVDATGSFLVNDYIPSPSLANIRHVRSLADNIVQSLDPSELPPAYRRKGAVAAALALYETLSKIQLPPFESIPDADIKAERWVIPNTEIALVRVKSGPHSGEFLFSAETVAKAKDFYERVHGLSYTRPVPLKNFREMVVDGAGWPIPFAWVQAMPAWLQAPLADQAAWKWIALALLFVFFVLLLRLAYRMSHLSGSEHPVLHALAQLALPGYFIIATPVFKELALGPINLFGSAGNALELAMTAVMFLAGAWLSWRLAPVAAEAVIASPQIAPESIDAHLIRICARLLGIIAGAVLLGLGANQLGIPVYGIIAGLSVGGLALALAAQPTIENLIGGLTLFADKPLRVGDLCKYGSDQGTIEAIGIRSTRIRGADRSLTTIPNATLAKMAVVNLTQRDRMLIQNIIGVRCETSPDQLRYLLTKIRELLLSHPRIHPDAMRVRFMGFGASSLDIEVFAYVATGNFPEFLGIREDIFLRIMDIVAESGTDFAFPSQTLYFSRDSGLQSERTEAAEAQVRQWRDQGTLPFPDFSAEEIQRMRETSAYPTPDSPDAPVAGQKQTLRKAEE
jgi:MscS family membrane protein